MAINKLILCLRRAFLRLGSGVGGHPCFAEQAESERGKCRRVISIALTEQRRIARQFEQKAASQQKTVEPIHLPILQPGTTKTNRPLVPKRHRRQKGIIPLRSPHVSPIWLALLATIPLAAQTPISNPPLQVQAATVPQGAAIQMNFSTGTSVSCSGGICTVTATGTGGTGNPGVYIPVTFSTTPTFTATSNTDNSFSITLTGNVSSSTLAGSAAGQILNFRICQDGTGGRTFSWPSGFSTAPTISPIASACTKAGFFWDGSNARLIAPGTVDSGPGYVGLQAAPGSNPSSGFIYSWCDSTDLDCEILNSAGKTYAMALKGGDYNPVTGVVTAINGTAFPASATVIGSNASSQPVSQSATTVTAFLNVFSSTLKGLVPLSGGGTTSFLRADGSFAVPAGTGPTYTATCAANQVLYASAATTIGCDSGFTYAGSGGAVTLTGQFIDSFAATAGNPALKLSGVPCAGVTCVSFLVQPSTATPYSGNANGSQMGANCPSTSGDMFDGEVNGTAKLTIACADGSIAIAGNYTGNLYVLGGSGKSIITSTVNGDVLVENNTQNGFTRLQLGGTTSSFGAVCVTNQVTPILIACDAAGGLTESFQATAHLSNGTKFTLSGCGAGTTTGGASSGKFSSGTTGTCTVVITIAGATGLTAPNGWSCYASDQTTPANAFSQTANSATTCTLQAITTTGDVVTWGTLGW